MRVAISGRADAAKTYKALAQGYVDKRLKMCYYNYPIGDQNTKHPPKANPTPVKFLRRRAEWHLGTLPREVEIEKFMPRSALKSLFHVR